MYALLGWKERVREMKEVELEALEEQGNDKITNLEEEINELEDSEHELR